MSFDRDKPLYRVFLAEDSDAVVGWYIVQNYRPTDLVEARELALIRELVGDPPWLSDPHFEGSARWSHLFWAAVRTNRKGTIYARD